jgi:hypothetical protein
VNKRELLPPQIIFTPRKRKKEKRKEEKKRIYSSNSQRSGGCQGFLAEYYPTKGRCGDCGKNTKCATFTYGKRNGYLCIFIFFGGKYLIQKVLIFH